MADFATKNLSAIEPTTDELCIGFGKCPDGVAGMPLTAAYINGVLRWIARCLVPSGSILLWSGDISTIPTGWVACDGDNSTPDLTDRFVLGAGANFAQGTAGGAVTKTTSQNGGHDHGGNTQETSLTVAQIPAHDHDYEDASTSENFSEGADADGNPPHIFSTDSTQTKTTESTGGGEGHSHEIDAVDDHDHEVNVMPPYHALIYIMKT